MSTWRCGWICPRSYSSPRFSSPAVFRGCERTTFLSLRDAAVTTASTPTS
jgi:hypothetical protein